jgi:hypothetical protein
MPQYRFVVTDASAGTQRAEEYGIFNDQGAMQFARRFGHNREIEVWQQERLVGRVGRAAEPAIPA